MTDVGKRELNQIPCSIMARGKSSMAATNNYHYQFILTYYTYYNTKFTIRPLRKPQLISVMTKVTSVVLCGLFQATM